MTAFPQYKDTYESTKVVVVYLIVIPIGGIVFLQLWEKLLDVCCDQDEQKVLEVAPTAQSRTMAIAPILTKMPPNFRFANYVNENESESSDWPSSALSLNNAINIPSLLAPCAACGTLCKHAKSRKTAAEIDLTIPSDERPGSISRQTTKMADVAGWLATQDQSGARGGALLLQPGHDARGGAKRDTPLSAGSNRVSYAPGTSRDTTSLV